MFVLFPDSSVYVHASHLDSLRERTSPGPSCSGAHRARLQYSSTLIWETGTRPIVHGLSPRSTRFSKVRNDTSSSPPPPPVSSNLTSYTSHPSPAFAPSFPVSSPCLLKRPVNVLRCISRPVPAPFLSCVFFLFTLSSPCHIIAQLPLFTFGILI